MRTYFHCRDCPKRYPGCHDHCRDYAEAMTCVRKEKKRRVDYLESRKLGRGTNGLFIGCKRLH